MLNLRSDCVITRLKCVLLEDEIPGLTYLKMLCEQIPEVEIVKSFTDPEKFLQEAPVLDFELCILDIEMPRVNGMQIARMLRDKFIVFTTAYKHYAADAFDIDAVDFVTKPVTRDRLHNAVRKALDRRKLKDQPRQVIQLNTDKGKSLLDVSEIAYITTALIDSRDKVAVMMDHTTVVLKNISYESIMGQLPERSFCRVNKKQVIALKIVSAFTFDEITTSLRENGNVVKFPLSETYRQHFQKLAGGLS